jgi:hypothetical protein
MIIIKIVCFFVLLLLLVYHTIRTQSVDSSDIIIDNKSQIGGTVQDIEDKIDTPPKEQNVKPNSSIHPLRKQGWCYIGTDRGNRSCLKVGVNDYCHSQHIYPTSEICIHPNLRF